MKHCPKFGIYYSFLRTSFAFSTRATQICLYTTCKWHDFCHYMALYHMLFSFLSFDALGHIMSFILGNSCHQIIRNNERQRSISWSSSTCSLPQPYFGLSVLHTWVITTLLPWSPCLWYLPTLKKFHCPTRHAPRNIQISKYPDANIRKNIQSLPDWVRAPLCSFSNGRGIPISFSSLWRSPAVSVGHSHTHGWVPASPICSQKALATSATQSILGQARSAREP